MSDQAPYTLIFDGQSELPVSIRPVFDRIGYEIRNDFVNMTEECSSSFESDIDWWVTLPASRDVLNSRIFYYCCVLELVKELMGAPGQIREIRVRSKALFRILKHMTDGEDISIRLERPSFIKRLLGVKPFLGSVWLVCAPFRFARKFKSRGKVFPEGSLTLIDTFVVPGFVETDRYYANILDFVTEEEREDIYFVPTFSGFSRKEYRGLMSSVRYSSRRFLLKEDFLRWSDYLYAFLHVMRKRGITLPMIKFRGIDITSLFKEEIMSRDRVPLTMRALLNYRFAMRLHKAGVALRQVVDWFENQIIDKGWNAGFRRWYPRVPRVGYQGMLVSDHWLHKYPTEAEVRAGVVPDIVMAPGPAPAEELKEFSSNVRTRKAPALRFSGVFKERARHPDESYYTVLVGLPNFTPDAVCILRLIVGCVGELGELGNIRFHIKRHPAISMESIKQEFGRDNWPEQFTFVEGDFNDCIEESNLLISSTSSVCVEALAKGTPVLVVGSSNGLTYNPIPRTVDSSYWRLCHSADDLAEGVRYFRDNPRQVDGLSRSIINEYFTPVNRDTVKEFLFSEQENEETISSTL